MRNICFAARLAELENRSQFGFLFAYVAAAPAASDGEKDFADFKKMLLPVVAPCVGTISYEQLGDIVRRHGQAELADWLAHRISHGIAASQALGAV